MNFKNCIVERKKKYDNAYDKADKNCKHENVKKRTCTAVG